MESDPGAIAEFVKILTGLGLPGLVIAALAWHDWQVQKRNMSLNDKLLDVTEKYSNAVGGMTTAVNRLGDLLLRGKAPE
jgi:hypothetical protein